MTAQLPKHVIAQYGKRSRDFKAQKRKGLKLLAKALDNFRNGSAFLPCGSYPIQAIDKIIERMKIDLSVKNWGR